MRMRMMRMQRQRRQSTVPPPPPPLLLRVSCRSLWSAVVLLFPWEQAEALSPECLLEAAGLEQGLPLLQEEEVDSLGSPALPWTQAQRMMLISQQQKRS